MDRAGKTDLHMHRTLTLLHVEDSRTDYVVIKGVLQNIPGSDFTIHHASTLESALSTVQEIDFDAVLLDLSLPDSQGLDTIKKMHDAVPHKPIILLTAADSEETIIQGIRIGAQDYLPKGNAKPDLMKRTIFAAIDRKKVTEALKISQERFDLAVRGSSVGLWDWDVKNNELYWSDRFKKILGITDEDFTPDFASFKGRLHREDHDWIMEAIHKHLDNDQEYDVEYRLLHEEGHYVWVHARGQAIWDEHAKPTRMAGSVEDITDKKQATKEKLVMEMQLRHAQKLEAIGQLAAGIAHEINTPSQFVGDNARFMQSAFKDITQLIGCYHKLTTAVQTGQPTEPSIDKIKHTIEEIDLDFLLEEIPNAARQSLDGVERIGSIVKAMKEFSHPGSAKKERVDLNTAIENTITVSRNEWKYVADMKTDFDRELTMVECLPGELNQVILNMIVNAAHAIADVAKAGGPPKGVITICTERLGDNFQITIGDTGAGIPDDIRNKIFDPFFTTKGVGSGTGQGLAIAYSIVTDKHQGTISVDSVVGKGTVFIIRIPVASPAEPSSAQGDSLEKEVAVC